MIETLYPHERIKTIIKTWFEKHWFFGMVAPPCSLVVYGGLIILFSDNTYMLILAVILGVVGCGIMCNTLISSGCGFR